MAEYCRGPALTGPVVFLESGLRFEADVLRGQKTGFFLDQRENRRRVESSARGRRVLNAYSISGGFSLYAARGGARSVTDLDLAGTPLTALAQFWAQRIRTSPLRAVPMKPFKLTPSTGWAPTNPAIMTW